MLKKSILALALSGALATTAAAGNMAEPIMEPMIIMEATEAASSGSAVLPVIIFALLAAVALATD